MRAVGPRHSPVLRTCAAALTLGILLLAGCSPDPEGSEAGENGGGGSASGPVDLPETGDWRIVLTPTATPDSSQSISWLGAEPDDDGVLQIGVEGDDQTEDFGSTSTSVINGNPRPQHSATATDLGADTTYRYRVGTPDRWSPWLTFTTAASDTQDFSFLYFGDAQVGLDTTWPAVVEAALARDPDADLTLAAGDLINNADSDEQWNRWFAGLGGLGATRNLVAVPGNHEHVGDSVLDAWRALFELPDNGPSTDTIEELAELAQGSDQVSTQYAAYFDRFAEMAAESVYFTDYQGVRFAVLDGTRDQAALQPDDLPPCSAAECPANSPGDAWMRFQAAWLDQVLADSDARWTVVSIHQPIYSSTEGFDEGIVREQLLPVLQEREVDLVLMGHDHVYSRGFTDSNATDTQGLTSGPVFVTSNSGGQHLVLETDPAKNVWTVNDATQVRRVQGVATYQTIDVTDEALAYRSYLVETSGKADTDLEPGDLVDEFTVTQDDDGQTWVTEPGVQPPGEG